MLLPVAELKGETQLLYTLRSQKVASHKGQVSFPGGLLEDTDPNLKEAALRETEEEVGLKAQQMEILGQLDETFTPFGFHITPFVAWVKGDLLLKPNEEIAQAFWVDLKDLLNPKNCRMEEKEYEGKNYPFPFYQIGPHQIWGATGRMTYCLLERLKKVL